MRDKTNKTRVEVPEKARAKMLVLWSQKQIADLRLESFVQGCFETLQLEGDWDLDTQTWVFNLRPTPKETEKVEKT